MDSSLAAPVKLKQALSMPSIVPRMPIDLPAERRPWPTIRILNPGMLMNRTAQAIAMAMDLPNRRGAVSAIALMVVRKL